MRPTYVVILRWDRETRVEPASERSASVGQRDEHQRSPLRTTAERLVRRPGYQYGDAEFVWGGVGWGA